MYAHISTLHLIYPIVEMQNLTPEQAQALWDAGGFIVLPDLPEGSEYGLDGTYHTIRQSFTGSKFVPPGLHLVTISPVSTGSSSTNGAPHLGPGAISLRSGIFVHLRPRERLILSYDPKTESLVIPSSSAGDDGGKEVVSLISDDHLRALDPGLAAYPFEGLEAWKSLISAISEAVSSEVLGSRGAGVDGMRGAEGDEDDLAAVGAGGESGTGEKMRFAQFDLRRSWGEGVVGEELTRQARDKSWLLAKVIERLGGDPITLLAHLQLAFILVLHLSSPASLTVYKRILSLLARSADIHSHPSAHLPKPRHAKLRTLYTGLVITLAAQLSVLPDGVFDTELPELDVWFVEELETLRTNLGAGMGASEGLWAKGDAQKQLKERWEGLRSTARQKLGWQTGDLRARTEDAGLEDGEEEEEEGEYAPVVVDM